MFWFYRSRRLTVYDFVPSANWLCCATTLYAGWPHIWSECRGSKPNCFSLANISPSCANNSGRKHGCKRPWLVPPSHSPDPCSRAKPVLTVVQAQIREDYGAVFREIAFFHRRRQSNSSTRPLCGTAYSAYKVYKLLENLFPSFGINDQLPSVPGFYGTVVVTFEDVMRAMGVPIRTYQNSRTTFASIPAILPLVEQDLSHQAAMLAPRLRRFLYGDPSIDPLDEVFRSWTRTKFEADVSPWVNTGQN